MPDLCITWRSSVRKERVSFGFPASRTSWMVVRVTSGIFPLVLIHTSVVMECVANSSFPSRHQPLCLLLFPSTLPINFASRKGGWVLLLPPIGWVRRIQLSVVERVGIRSCPRNTPIKPNSRLSKDECDPNPKSDFHGRCHGIVGSLDYPD